MAFRRLGGSLSSQTKNRSNSLYRDPPWGKSALDEETLFIGGLGTVRISPLGACYPDLHNYLIGACQYICGSLAFRYQQNGQLLREYCDIQPSDKVG